MRDHVHRSACRRPGRRGRVMVLCRLRCCFVGQPSPIGMLIDRFGYRVPAILSALGSAATLVLIGLSSNVFMFAASGVLSGLGIGTAMSTFQAMAVASVEPWRRGVATATYMTAFDLGIAIGALLGGVLADFAGYTVMYLTIAVFPLIAAIISAVTIKKSARTTGV